MGRADVEVVEAAGPAQGDRALPVGHVVAEPEVAPGAGAGGFRLGRRPVRLAGSQWRVLPPAGFPDEAALHGLVEETPELLPLAGSPRLAIVGREVHLGPGYADLLAVESSGRLVVIEVKLAKNAEARRVVVAQVLTYAAYLHGMDRTTVEKELLGAYLSNHGLASLADAVKAKDQGGSFDPVAFDSGVASCLSDGRFRLVLVLDSAPAELTQLVGYLESVGNLVIDLVTVAAYQVGEERLLVPRRTGRCVHSQRGASRSG